MIEKVADTKCLTDEEKRVVFCNRLTLYRHLIHRERSPFSNLRRLKGQTFAKRVKF